VQCSQTDLIPIPSKEGIGSSIIKENKMSQVTWKPIVGYEGAYSVSDSGLVRSEDRPREVKVLSQGGATIAVNQPKKTTIMKGKILSLSHTTDYLSVNLSKAGKSKSFRVAWLVAEAFLGKCPNNLNKLIFKDNDLTNNKVANLAWQE
jgi:hypothetical protein